jgi:hypothetical protein
VRRAVCAALTAALSLAALASYYPHQLKESWTYSDGEVQRIAREVQIGGQQVAELDHLFGKQLASVDLISYRSSGVYLVGQEISGKRLLYTPPLLIYPKSPLTPGLRWSSQALQTGGLRVRLSAEVVGETAISLPLGTFNALIIETAIQTSSGAKSLEESYFVPGLGTVRYVTSGGVVDLVKSSP